jgi:RNA polymerase sigma factor (sigma-70 family)
MAQRTAAVLNRVIRGTEYPDVSDRELLQRFASGGDQAAFTRIVRRHGAMVLGVCRRSLANSQDAEDACQATFVLLAKKAADGNWRPSIANWLYAAARKVARNARIAADRRVRRESKAAVAKSIPPLDQMTGRELLAVLDEELDRLPPRYREPLVLCYLQGLTRDEAAARLGIPPATLKSQLDRRRKRLGEALTRRGVVLGAALLTLSATSRVGAVPARVVNAVLDSVRGSPPPAVAELCRGVAMNCLVKKSTVAVMAAIGVVVLIMSPGSAPPSAAGPPEKDTPAKSAAGAPKEKSPADFVSYAGRAVDIDGRPVAGANVAIIPRHGKADGFEPIPAATPTDRDGGYLLRVPRARLMDRQSGDEIPAMVLATAAGYFPGWTAAPVDGRIVMAPADTKVAGRITDLEGRPAAETTVQITAVYAPSGGTLDSWVDALRRDRNSSQRGKLGPAIPADSLPGVSTAAKTDADGRFEIPGYAKDRILHAKISGPTLATQTVGLLTRDVGPAALVSSTDTPYYGTAGVISVKPSRLINGVVRDRATGKPVAGVTVQSLMMAGSSRVESGLAKTTTGSDGKFTLTGMPKGAGNRLLVVPARGQPYLTSSVEVPDPYGVDPVAVDVQLERGISIEGVVRDRAGRPIPNVQVVYFANRFNDRVTHAGYGARSAETPPTGADGKFQVVGLPGTGYLVAVGRSASYLAATERTGDGASEILQLDTVSFPARADGFHAVYELDVPRNASEFRQNITLERGTNVTVTVVDRVGKTVSECRSLSRHANDDWRGEARPGEHRVEGVNPKQPRTVVFRHAERNLTGVLSLPVGFTDAMHRLVLQPGVTLTGRVLSDDGRPRAAVPVSLFFLPNKESSGDWRRYRNFDEQIITDADGRFRVPALAPGFTYEVAIDGQFVTNSRFDLDAKTTGTKDLGDLRLRPPGE